MAIRLPIGLPGLPVTNPLRPRGPLGPGPGSRGYPPATTPSPQGGGGSGGGASGGGGQAGGAPDSNPELLTRGAGPNPEWIIRDFTGGMHVNSARDAIGEQDLWWMENLQPLASGNVVPSAAFGFGFSGATAATANVGLPYYTTMLNLGSRTLPAPFLFTCFPDGSAWLTNLGTGVGTQIMAPGTLNTVNMTYAVNYTGSTRLGFLIIDPNGYWDYNLTTAATLTNLSSVITTGTNTFKRAIIGGTSLKQVFTTGALTPPAAVQVHYTVTSVVISAAGTGYVLGDVLTFTDGVPFTPAQVTVTNIGGGGTVTAIALSTGGDYPGPASTVLTPTGPSGAAVSITGGSGTGFACVPQIESTKLVVTTEGPGTTNPVVMSDETATNVVIDTWNIAVGSISGTSIATYAGRVWIGNANTLTYTDVNSYNAFGGAGGASTFSDQYLLQGITVLYPANNYLYMFGSTSVDVISNVTVNATTGVTAFSRVNALQGLGCLSSNNMTVIGFARGIVFLDLTGLYMLAGATPERLSERIQGCLRAGFNFGGGSPQSVRPSCGIANLNSELCLVLQFNLADTFSHPSTQTNRVLVFVYQRHRWWVASDQFGDANLASTPVGPLSGTPPFAGNFGVWRLQSPGTLPTCNATSLFTGNKHWQLRTKLWDGGKAFSEKQGINVAISGVWVTPGPAQSTGVTFTVDSELQNTAPALSVPNIPTLYTGQYNYALQVIQGVMANAQAYGGQYIGMTFFGALVLGTQQVSVLECIAMRGKQERNMLE